jgi:hypothetical protein
MSAEFGARTVACAGAPLNFHRLKPGMLCGLTARLEAEPLQGKIETLSRGRGAESLKAL